MMKSIAVALMLCGSGVASAQVTVPHQFQSGQQANAADVNANFEALRTAVSRSAGRLVVRPTKNQGNGAVAVSCPASTYPVGASCSCSSEGNRNFGTLFSCESVGNGAIAGCFVDNTFNPSLPVPLARVTAHCLGIVGVDGQWIPPTIEPVALDLDPIIKAAGSDALEEEFARLKAMEAARRAR